MGYVPNGMSDIASSIATATNKYSDWLQNELNLGKKVITLPGIVPQSGSTTSAASTSAQTKATGALPTTTSKMVSMTPASTQVEVTTASTNPLATMFEGTMSIGSYNVQKKYVYGGIAAALALLYMGGGKKKKRR